MAFVFRMLIFRFRHFLLLHLCSKIYDQLPWQKIVRMKVWILVTSLEQRSQWMALPILLQQVLVRFYDTTNVQKWIMVWWYMIIAYFLMHSFILQKLLRFVLPSLQQKYIFQNILLFTFLSTLCAETYSNCNSVQIFMNLGFDF